MTIPAATRSRYTCPAIEEIRDECLLRERAEDVLVEVDRVERLLLEISPRRRYTLAYVRQRITGRRGNRSDHTEISAEDLGRDLRQFIHDVTDSAGILVESAGERVMTIRELARQLNVSTKTITRWRRHGLVSRRFVFDDQKRLGYLQSSVDRFVARHPDLVRRGARFSHLTAEEREDIYGRARRLALAGASPMEVIRRVAAKVGRSVETIRYTLKQYDQQHSDQAIFPDHHGTVRPETKRLIFERYRRGEPIDALARQFSRTKASVQRIVAEVRLARIQQLPLDYVPETGFGETPSASEKEILGPLPSSNEPLRRVKLPPGLPSYLAALYEVPLLTRDQEVHLFRKLNYLKWKACQLRQRIDPQRPRNDFMDRIEKLHEETVAVKNQIIRANLRLVISIARRYVNPLQGFFELVSDGNMSLIRAVEKFDFSRGNKFSTYASWAIMKNFARTIPIEHRQHEQFRTSHEEMLPAVADLRSDEREQESAQTRREAQVERLMNRLDKREQMIISYRFGLNRGVEPLTLKQVGEAMGVTKERIRQIETRALDKLREAALEENIVLPGDFSPEVV